MLPAPVVIADDSDGSQPQRKRQRDDGGERNGDSGISVSDDDNETEIVMTPHLIAGLFGNANAENRGERVKFWFSRHSLDVPDAAIVKSNKKLSDYFKSKQLTKFL